jgi:hypothetical protein
MAWERQSLQINVTKPDRALDEHSRINAGIVQEQSAAVKL